MVDQSNSNASDLLYSISSDDLHLLQPDNQNFTEHYLASISGSSTSNIIGTHPTEIITSINPENGYPVRQENGQRKTGPPPGIDIEIESPSIIVNLTKKSITYLDWPTTRHPPGRGCEVFVGKLPRDCFESELFPLFERCGQIYEMRLMMDFSGFNRGYAFITYTCRDDAKRSVKELNNYEIRSNRMIGVCQSVDNCRLFVGGIPKMKKREEILEEMCKVTEGVVDVIVYPSAHDKTKNRGFAFVEYESHRSAAMARRKLLPGKIQLWGHQIAVDWAEPEAEIDEDVMATVRVLYVRNLMMTTNEEQIKNIFERFKPNSVERVKKLKDYAFVHFRERDDALHAMNLMNGREIDGSIVEVTLAKPVDKNQYFRFTRGVSPSTLVSSLPFTLQPGTTIAQTSTTYDLTPHLTAIPYLSVAATSLSNNSATTINNNSLPIVSVTAPTNNLQQKSVHLSLHGHGQTSGFDSSNSLLTSRVGSLTGSGGILQSSTRSNSSLNNVAHHRGAYYTILRPTARRSDEKCLEDLYKETYDALYGSATSTIVPPIMMIDSNQSRLILPEQQTAQQQQQSHQPDEIPLPAASINFHSGAPLYPTSTYIPHPLLSTHGNGNHPYPQSSILFTAANTNNPSQQYFQTQPQPNITFPMIVTPTFPSLTPTIATIQSSARSDSSMFSYPTSLTSTIANMDPSTITPHS